MLLEQEEDKKLYVTTRLLYGHSEIYNPGEVVTIINRRRLLVIRNYDSITVVVGSDTIRPLTKLDKVLK